MIFNGEFEDIRALRMDFWKVGPAEPEKVQKIDDFLRSYTKNSIADGDRPGLSGNLTGTVSGVVSVKFAPSLNLFEEWFQDQGKGRGGRLLKPYFIGDQGRIGFKPESDFRNHHNS